MHFAVTDWTDETGNGVLNYHKKIRDGNIKILLLNAANIINKNSTGIANGTAIGNLVFKVTGANADTASVKIAQEGFAACMPGDNTTAPALTPANSTFTPTNVTVSDSVNYPTAGAPTIYCLTSEKDGAVTLSLKASIADLQRLNMQLTLNGYADIQKAGDCPFKVDISGDSVTISHNAAPNTDGVDMRSGVAVLTMKKSGASQSIISEPKAIATKDASGALSPITKPIVTDDPEVAAVRTRVLQIMHGLDPRLSLHDFRMVSGSHHVNVIFDMVLPPEDVQTAEQLRRQIEAQLQDGKKTYHLIVTFDTAAFNKMTKEAQG